MCERCSECGKVICWSCLRSFNKEDKAVCKRCQPIYPGADQTGLPTDGLGQELRNYIVEYLAPLDCVLEVQIIGGPVWLRLKDDFEVIVTIEPSGGFKHSWHKVGKKRSWLQCE
jgi:hypothetical protein